VIQLPAVYEARHQPPLTRAQKWVLLLSTLYGCPVGCLMCDAGGYYKGKPSKEQIFEQIDFLVSKRFPDHKIKTEQWKIQFARMGEPALNPAVLDVLDELPARYDAPGLMPSISTIAPRGAGAFFDRLLEIKNEKYGGGKFQFQFSIHTTDIARREALMPVKKWGFDQMASYGEKFYQPGDLKITLNFALAQDMPVDPAVLRQYFDPEYFLIKITPLNPTYRARENKLNTYLDPSSQAEEDDLVRAMRSAGYQVIVSIGEPEENLIGSNCGQYIKRHITAADPLPAGYTYCLEEYRPGSVG
jgi:23S rRNA (adenine2503-C2)-methyltransferase